MSRPEHQLIPYRVVFVVTYGDGTVTGVAQRLTGRAEAEKIAATWIETTATNSPAFRIVHVTIQEQTDADTRRSSPHVSKAMLEAIREHTKDALRWTQYAVAHLGKMEEDRAFWEQACEIESHIQQAQTSIDTLLGIVTKLAQEKR